MKKIISIILIILMMVGIIVSPTKSVATTNEVALYSKGLFKNYLHWGAVGLIFNYVVYDENGQEYPAYCLNKDLEGITSDVSYSVGKDELITDVNIWRTIINGYPYKTIEELGCNTEEEAFMATKQAVYCSIYNRNPEKYVANNDVEQRVRNALIQIVTAAKNSTEIKVSANLTIKDVTDKWMQDDIDSNYVSKKFTISANSSMDSYSVELEGISIEGAKIVDENNKEKTEFKFGDIFKVIMPITNMKNNGSFNIKANGEVLTKPIYYGKPSNSNLQDYALTGKLYENGSGIKTVNYMKNETKIIILKEDDDANPLEGVKFRLLNKEGEVLHTDLTTNKEGKIAIENLEPGVYYLEETNTVNGYSIYEEKIQAEVGYNEELTIKVKNSKESIIIETPEIEKKEQEVVVKLPKTGM